jgi:hypothetical protein
VRRIFQLLAGVAGNAFRLLPRGARYAVAHRIALLIAPILRRTPYYARRPSRLDGYREESLRMMLRVLARSRVRFDPDIDVRGRELFPDTPALIVSGHFLLNGHMTRWMFDAGREMTVVLGRDRETMYYSGTRRPVAQLIVGPSVLLQMRRRFECVHRHRGRADERGMDAGRHRGRDAMDIDQAAEVREEDRREGDLRIDAHR